MLDSRTVADLDDKEQASGETLLAMLRTGRQNHQRHVLEGGAAPEPATPEEAEAVLFLAVTIVQWFQRGYVVKEGCGPWLTPGGTGTQPTSFLETTDRPDIGVDLHAPVEDDAHHPHHAYALVPFVRPGDVVFHYQKKPTPAIVGWSRAAGVPFRDQIIWEPEGALPRRQASSRICGRAGGCRWRGHSSLTEPVTLRNFGSWCSAVRQEIEAAEAGIAGTLYRPFQLSDRQPLRGTQHYLTKMPLGVVMSVPGLLTAADDAGNDAAPQISPPQQRPMHPDPSEPLGQQYVAADEASASPERDPFASTQRSSIGECAGTR